MKQLDFGGRVEHTDEGCVDWLWFVVGVDAQRSDNCLLYRGLTQEGLPAAQRP